MSEQSIPLNTGQQATINTNLAKTFGWNIRTEYDNYVNNSTYDPITLKAGTLMGRIHATDVLVPLKSDANDGSQFPQGLLLEDMIIDGGDTVKCAIVVSGDVMSDRILFVKPGDGLETVVSSRRLKDRIQADTVGIKIVFNTTEMSGLDNQ